MDERDMVLLAIAAASGIAALICTRGSAAKVWQRRVKLLDDTSLRALIGELGNQIHNLSCEYQNDEDLADRLRDLRGMAWDLAQAAPTEGEA